jgi:hypothetical protein
MAARPGRCCRALAVLVALGALGVRAEPSAEVLLCLQHLRAEERPLLEKALGPVEGLPLYRVALEVDPEARQVKGRVQVLVQPARRTLTQVLLRVPSNARAPNVKLRHASVNGQPAVLEQPEPTLYRVPLDPHLPVGTAALIEVLLEATVPRSPASAAPLLGALLSHSDSGDHGAYSAGPGVLSLAGLLPMIPPEDAAGEPFPGPGKLGDLALFEPSHILSSVTVPEGWQALTAGVALGEVPQKDGRIQYSWAAAAVRDFPLLVTRGYKSSSRQLNGMVVESWYAPGNEKAGKAALDHAARALEVFASRLGPLPWTRFRVVEAPLSGGAGGMEFSGLITVSSGLYGALSDPTAALGLPGLGALLGGAGEQLGALFADTVEFTVAHEVAHQYFPMLVGSDPVNEPWVDETLAQYLAVLYLEWTKGPQAAKQARQQVLAAPYHLYRLGGGADGPAARATGEFSTTSEYAALVYGKGALLHHELRTSVGDAAFFKALRAYLDEHRHRWACTGCFPAAVGRASPKKAKQVEALRLRWWEQAHGDADLGPADLGQMMEQLGGQKLELDPKTLELLQQVLQGLGGR